MGMENSSFCHIGNFVIFLQSPSCCAGIFSKNKIIGKEIHLLQARSTIDGTGVGDKKASRHIIRHLLHLIVLPLIHLSLSPIIPCSFKACGVKQPCGFIIFLTKSCQLPRQQNPIIVIIYNVNTFLDKIRKKKKIGIYKENVLGFIL